MSPSSQFLSRAAAAGRVQRPAEAALRTGRLAALLPGRRPFFTTMRAASAVRFNPYAGEELLHGICILARNPNCLVLKHADSSGTLRPVRSFWGVHHGAGQHAGARLALAPALQQGQF